MSFDCNFRLSFVHTVCIFRGLDYFCLSHMNWQVFGSFRLSLILRLQFTWRRKQCAFETSCLYTQWLSSGETAKRYASDNPKSWVIKLIRTQIPNSDHKLGLVTLCTECMQEITQRCQQLLKKQRASATAPYFDAESKPLTLTFIYNAKYLCDIFRQPR